MKVSEVCVAARSDFLVKKVKGDVLPVQMRRSMASIFHSHRRGGVANGVTFNRGRR